MTGYIYSGGRSVLRIQRHTPKDRLRVACFLHRNCNFMMHIKNDPGDSELKKWLYETDATIETDDNTTSKRKTREHKQLARTRWGAF